MKSSLEIIENHSLRTLNTFGVPAVARYFVEVHSTDMLKEALAYAREHKLAVIPLGGGSNVVLGDRIEGLVIAVALKGRNILSITESFVQVEAAAGENWHDFVLWTLQQSAFGLENLSLIPGSVGASPIQNIGAYGVELKDRFVSLVAVHVPTGKQRIFNSEDCAFGYRDSVFKQALRDQYIIISVRLHLDVRLQPRLGYGQLVTLLKSRLGDKEPSGLDISQAVTDIRRDKLPDPGSLGNAGSFFKNPVVSDDVMSGLKKRFPDLVVYPAGDQWKLAAGWLIDKAGLRGVRHGSVGTYQHQALVLINHGTASGQDIRQFAEFVRQEVKAMFDVQLETEPRFY